MTEKEQIKLRDIQEEALQILLVFTDICNRNHLTYYISGGTFLGAVRHHGFIPWDDDVDVAMPRKDYQRFLEIAKRELPESYTINHFTKKRDSIYYVPKIENSKYQLRSKIAQNEKIVNLWIDVFPLDGLPDNKIVRKLHCFHLLYLRAAYKLALFDTLVNYRNKNRPWYENVIIFLARRIPLGRLFNARNIMFKLDKTLSKYDFYKSTDIMNFMGSYKFKSIMNRKEIYAEGALYDFEGHQFNAPKDYDRYLTIIYGDYMKLPPARMRNWHQTEIIQNEEKDRN